jgi:hypothetical protein
MKNEEFKKGLPGVGKDLSMIEFKCEFCGHEMDDYAETFDDGQYTRTIAYRCANKECPGPPQMVEKSRLDEAYEIIATLSKPMVCGVCLGIPLESRRMCVCRGVGTESAELAGVRAMYHELNIEYENLEAELDAVMVSVDKWLEGKELKNNPATRAADAREKALKAIESRK